MTVSWGAMGFMWGKPSVTVYIRPQRYTKEFVDTRDTFTLSFYPAEKKDYLITRYLPKRCPFGVKQMTRMTEIKDCFGECV